MAGYRGASEAVILGLDVTLAKPAGVVSGDVLVAGIYRSTNADAVTAPAGWSLVDSIAHEGGELAIYSKVAGGAEPTSYVWTWPSNNRGGAGLIALTDASGNIIGLPTETTGTGNAPAPPDSGTVTSGDHVAIVIAGQEGKATSRFTPPAGYTEAADSGSTGGGGDASHGGIGIAYELLTAATQATPDDFASTISDDWVCQTLLVEAAAPAADRAARVTWAELEAPDASRAARVTWAELETPDPPATDRAARVTWAELEAPDASRAARVTWAELETPDPPATDRAARVTWAELEAPDASRAARVTWAELETPDPPATDRAARVTWAELEAPDASRAARVTWAELETPDPPATDRAARVTWAELEAPDASRAARVTWAELETPDPPATDRAARVTWAELEAPDASRAARVTWAELETPSSGFRAARLIWAVLRAPSPLPTGVGAPPNEHGAELFVTVEDVTTGARWDLTQWDVGQWDQAGQPVALAPRLISLATRIGRARTTDPHRASSLSVQVDGRDYITRGFEPMRDVSVRFSPATGQAAQFAFTGKLQAVQDLLSPVRLPRATMQAAGPLGTLARAKITGVVVDPGTAATPAARAQAILDDLQLDGLTLAGWPATPALYTGDSLIGENALGALRAAAAAAQGSPWVTPDGASLEFLQDWPTPGATPIEVGAGELLDPSQVQTDYSVRNVANYVTGSSPDPAVADYAAQDVISQGLYEVATSSLEVPVTSAAALAAVVNRRLAISKQARREVLGVQVPILSPATAQAALAVELGDVLHVVYRDAQDPAVHFDLYVRVEGIEHSVKTQNRVRSWVVTFRTDEARTEAGDLWTP